MTGSRQGSFFMRDRYKSNSRFTCTTDLTHGESRSPLSRYGRHYKPRRSLRCHCNFIVVVYYLKISHYKGLASPLRLSYLTIPVEAFTVPYFSKALPWSYVLKNYAEALTCSAAVFKVFLICTAHTCVFWVVFYLSCVIHIKKAPRIIIFALFVI